LELVVKKHRCNACGRLFQPCRKVKSQRYCSKPSCQRERKRRWQSRKRTEDPAYRASQRDAHKRWQANNRHYWRDYPKRHSDYELGNRERQRERNRLSRQKSEPIAKMDALVPEMLVIPVRYRLVPLEAEVIAKMYKYHGSPIKRHELLPVSAAFT